MDDAGWIFSVLCFLAAGFTALGWRLGLWVERHGTSKRDVATDLASIEHAVERWKDEQ